MSTEALKQFRQKFVRISMEQRMNLSLGRAKEVPRPAWSSHVAQGDRVLVLGTESVNALHDVARQAGPGGAVTCLVDDLHEVPGLRERLTPQRPGEEEAGILVGCAAGSDFSADLEWLERELRQEPVDSLQSLHRIKGQLARRAAETPLVPEASVNVVLFDAASGRLSAAGDAILRETWRALGKGGQIIIDCLVSDEPLSPDDLGELRQECAQRSIPTEEEFLSEMERAGFYGVELLNWDESPLHLVRGVEIRKVTARAFKGKEGACYDCLHAVIYRGPWKRVHDDDGHAYRRGERTAVCEKTYRILTSGPYAGSFIPIPPYINVPLEEARPFACQGVTRRDPGVSKGLKEAAPTGENQPPAGCGC
ncbi:MAG: hypothetical protein ABW208_14545 [Pyrinomonadaceae bacterium]